MALKPSEELTFDEDDLGQVIGAMLAMTHGSHGWINLVPEVEPGHEPPPRNLAVVLFSARGDAVPLATWSAPTADGERASIGIEHGSGPRALARLAEHDLALPDGWFKVADHPRRWLVVTVPPTADHEDVLWWLLTAAHILSTPPLTGNWLARLYRP